MTKRFVYILFLISTSCTLKTDKKELDFFLGRRTSYKSCDFADVSTRAVKKLNDELHGVSFMSSTGQPVSKDRLSSLIYQILGLGLTNKETYETYSRACQDVDIVIWQSIGHENAVAKIQKMYLKAIIPLSDGGKNIITVTDFDIYSVNKPKHVALRVIDDQDLEYLKVDEIEYTRVAESIPEGLDIAKAKVDSAKENACR